jgi:hypothetical protein
MSERSRQAVGCCRRKGIAQNSLSTKVARGEGVKKTLSSITLRAIFRGFSRFK